MNEKTLTEEADSPITETSLQKKPTTGSRISSLLLYTVLVISTLVSFPSILPQVVGFWLFFYLYGVIQGKPSAFPIAMAIFAICLKGSFYHYVSILLTIVLSMGLLTHFLTANHQRKRTIQVVVSFFLILSCIGYWGHYHLSATCSYKVSFDEMGPIVCLGDSLTAGGYPGELKMLQPFQVVDKGINGIETEDGLKELDKITQLRPSIVVIELGGHDYNNGKPRQAAKKNLTQIIDRLQFHEIEVVLVETPRGIFYDPYRGLERELAAEFDLELVSDSAIRTFVFLGPAAPPGIFLPKSWQRSDDGLHPNKNGNKVLAQEVSKAVDRLLGK